MNPLKLLKLAHIGLVASLLLSGLAVALGYVFYQGLSLGAQVAAHVSLIVLPAILKISYVARLTALKQLGRPVH